MTSVVLFKFHQSFDVCRERVAMLRSFNPNIPVHALYSGPAGGRAAARAALGDLAVDIQQAPDRGADWAWLHNDLMTKQWYRTHGRDIEFDRVYEYDWDLLTAAPLSDIYPDTADDEIALCAAVQFTEEIEQRWVWTNRSESFAQFMAYMGDTFGLRSLRWASLGPGPLLSRAFLEEFSRTEDIELVHGEISYPAYADALGFRVVNNNMRKSFLDRSEDRYFHCERGEIPFETIARELVKPDGRRAFHPVKYLVAMHEWRAGPA